MQIKRHSETHQRAAFEVKRPGCDVTFVLPDPKDRLTAKARTTIIIPPGSRWTPSPHWHEEHDEFFSVEQGRAWLTVDGQSRAIGPGDGPQRIAAYDVHDFGRLDTIGPASEMGGDADEASRDVIVKEWTEPADGMKEVFFRNLFSAIEEAPKLSPWRTELQLLLVQAHCDNYPSLVAGGGRIWQPLTHVVFWFAVLLGGWLGLRPWHDEWTPAALRETAETRGGQSPSSSKDR